MDVIQDKPRLQITLAAARVNAGMTQEDVAKEMGVSKNTIINIEKGKRQPKMAEISFFSDLYKVPKDFFLLPS